MLNNHRFYLLMLVFFCWPYSWLPLNNGYLPTAWRFAFAFFIMAILSKREWPKDWMERLGLKMSPSQILCSLLVFGVSLGGFFYMIQGQLLAEGLYQAFSSPGQHLGGDNVYVFSWLVNRIFQPLNEEIVLRALLLTLLTKIYSHKFTVSILAALVFTSLHPLLYALIPDIIDPLSMNVLITLFCFSFASNALFFATGHIGFGLALHISWNIWHFFGPVYQHGRELNEVQVFNLFIGATPITVLVTLMCGLSIMAVWLKGTFADAKNVRGI